MSDEPDTTPRDLFARDLLALCARYGFAIEPRSSLTGGSLHVRTATPGMAYLPPVIDRTDGGGRMPPDGVRFAHCIYEATVTADRASTMALGVDEMLVPLVDAEGDVVAWVPDVPGLVNPDRPLPELIAEILNAAAER